MRRSTTISTTVMQPATNQPTQQRESLSNAALLLRQTTQAATSTQEDTVQIPEYTKSHCAQALQEMSDIIITHQNTPQWGYFAAESIARLMCDASMIGQAEMRLAYDDDNVSPRAASQLHNLILDLKERLLCPLSRQPMLRPVLDPLATEPFRLAFEERHLANFYEMQRHSATLISTELLPASSMPDIDSITFQVHPLLNDLCQWLRTYFPETETTDSDNTVAGSHAVAVAANSLPTHLSVYSINIAITEQMIADIELEESQKQHDDQHQARMQVMATTNAQLIETREQTERIVQEKTEQIMCEIQDLQRQCQARCDDLQTKNIAVEERLAQEAQLRTELDRQLNLLQKNYWNKISEYNLATNQLNDIQSKFTRLNESHSHIQRELATTQTQFSQAQQHYNSALSFASNERYRLQLSLNSLQERYSRLDRRNDELCDDLRRAQNSDDGGWCVIQ